MGGGLPIDAIRRPHGRSESDHSISVMVTVSPSISNVPYT